MLKFATRRQIDDSTWDRCVSRAHNALLYGHTWYLDAVTYLPDWEWEGLILCDETGRYVAVLPIPLRRRWGRWVVYQPLFCQFLAIFSAQPLDPTPFIERMYKRYRHASKFHLQLQTPLVGLPQIRREENHTHVLLIGEVNLYTADRRMNLRRAARRIANVPDWQVATSTDIEPLLTIFRENHADEIGVGSLAYALFRGVFEVLQQRELGTLHYAWADGEIVAGALFVEQHGRIIYLFNAANAEGRRLNARSIILDLVIQVATKKATSVPTLLDFESPDKPGIVAFYESFGAKPQPFIVVSWSRLNWLERTVLAMLKKLKNVIS